MTLMLRMIDFPNGQVRDDRGCDAEPGARGSSLIPHPSSLIPHPSSLILSSYQPVFLSSSDMSSMGTGKTMVEVLSPAMPPSVCR